MSLAHPLYGEILRGRMPALTRRRLLLAHADRIDAYGARRREDAVRVATARLEATGWADPDLLVKAARLARYGQDFGQVERLGRAALLGGMTAEAGLLVGEALHELGRFDEAEQVLSGRGRGGDAGRRAARALTEIRSRNLMWGLLRFDDALGREPRRPRAGGGPGRCRGAGPQRGAAPRLLRAAARGARRAGAHHRPDPPTRPGHPRLAEVPALVATGRCEQATEEAGRAFAEHSALPEQIAIPGPGVHLVTQIYALTECGRLVEAEHAGDGGLRGHAGQRAARRAASGSRSSSAGARSLSGHPVTARRWLGEALARCEAHEMVSAHRLVLSALATAHALAGRR